MSYFDKLNYSLANEDTRIEYELLEDKLESVLCVAGSGSRALPLLARHPHKLEIIDLTETQLYLAELRIQAARQLTHEEFLFFLGYRGALTQGSLNGDDRLPLFEKLDLSQDCKEFWQKHSEDWSSHGFIFLGKWERHFLKLGYLFRNVLRMDLRPIFEAQSLEEQKQLYRKHFRPQVFKNFLRLVANEFVFNRFLYKGHFAGNEDRKTERKAPWQFLDDQFRHLFHTQLARKSYFLQMMFLGKIYYEEGLPIEAWPQVHREVQKAKTKIEYRKEDLLQSLPRVPHDFISLSDTISYLTDDQANNVLQITHKNTAPGSKVVIRSFLRGPKNIELDGWSELQTQNTWAEANDCTGVYRFHIFQKN